MNNLEFPDAKEATAKKRSSVLVWNVLTIMVLISIICVVATFALIYINPNSGINPFPPPTLVPTVTGPTATVTLRFILVPSWTPTVVMTQATQTPGVNQIQGITDTPTSSPSPSSVPSTVSAGGFAFEIEEGSPEAIAWSTFHPDAGCDWTGVAGQVISLNDEAVSGLKVQLGGSIPGKGTVDESSMTGYAIQYGPGGFEFTLAEELFASDGTLWIQLMDQQELPLSDKVYFDTYDDCQKNLIIISFNQVR